MLIGHVYRGGVPPSTDDTSPPHREADTDGHGGFAAAPHPDLSFADDSDVSMRALL
ncbi:RNA polymerase, partial [Gordonia sp. i37]